MITPTETMDASEIFLTRLLQFINKGLYLADLENTSVLNRWIYITTPLTDKQLFLIIPLTIKKLFEKDNFALQLIKCGLDIHKPFQIDSIAPKVAGYRQYVKKRSVDETVAILEEHHGQEIAQLKEKIENLRMKMQRIAKNSMLIEKDRSQLQFQYEQIQKICESQQTKTQALAATLENTHNEIIRLFELQLYVLKEENQKRHNNPNHADLQYAENTLEATFILLKKLKITYNFDAVAEEILGSVLYIEYFKKKWEFL